MYKNKIPKTMSFLLDDELDKALKNVKAQQTSTATAAAAAVSEKKNKTKKRKADAASSTTGNLEAKVRKAGRGTKNSNFTKEIKKLQQESEDVVKNAQPVDGQSMINEIREAEARAVKALSELDILLRVGGDAICQTAKYANLLSQLEQHRSESQVLEKVNVIFTKFIAAAANARESCARIPREFAEMLVKTDTFMRASSSSLVPTGMSVLVDQARKDAAEASANGQLVVRKPQQAMVTFAGPRSTNIFKLVVEDANRAQISALENSYLATSMLNSNFDPRISAAAKNSAQRDAQRHVALMNAGNEVTPELYGSQQYRKLQETVGAVARSALLMAPERLAIEEAK